VEAMLVAPAKKGQTYGSVNIMLGEEKLSHQSLIALEDVPEGGLWRQMVDSIKLMFK
ncbi:MAG: serine-type D-Ala-D-Ala carboxypeptidase, partial [Halobacteria archaeon]|nr:serine-type D-Ala-D-Ala carboxypeptidase [Halobacteria archaeon]